MQIQPAGIRFLQPHAVRAVLLALFGLILTLPGMEISFRNSTLFQQEKRGQKLEFDKQTPVIEFRAPESFRRAELLLEKQLPLPLFRKGILTVKLDCDPAVALENIHARIQEESGETLDFVCTTPVRDGRIHTFRIAIDPERPFSAWSGNRNRRIDFPAKFYNLALILKENASGRIRVESVIFEAELQEKQGLSAVAITLPSDQPVPLLDPRKSKRPELEFRNGGTQPFTVRAEIELSDFFERRLTRSGRLRLPPGSSPVRMALPELPARGIWKISCKLTDEKNGSVRLIERALCHLVPAGPETRPNPAFQFGICSGVSKLSDEELRNELRTAALCGAKFLRGSLEWRLIEPQPGKFDFSRVDRVLALCETNGIKPMHTLRATPAWAARDHRVWSGYPDREAWRRFVAAMAQRYAKKFTMWEIWNEPDLPTFAAFSADEYAGLVKIAAEEIHRLDPGTPVSSGGFATLSGYPGPRAAEFHRRALELCRELFDIHAYHEHGTFEDFARLVDQRFLPLRRETGCRMPWLANETSLVSVGGNERKQAEALVKKLVFAWSRGAIGYYWYDLRNDGVDPLNWEHNYGMVTREFQPKFVYGAYNTLASLLSAATFHADWSDRAEGYLYSFRIPGGRVLCGWNRGDDAEVVPVALPTGSAASVEEIDLMGNRRTIPAANGVTAIALVHTPRFWRIAGEEAQPAPLPRALSLKGPRVPGTAASGSWQVTIRNPFRVPARFRITSKSGSVTPAEVALQPGESRTSPFRFTRNDDDAIDLAAHAEGATGWTLACTVPLRRAYVPDLAGEKPLFVLNRQEQIHSSYGNDPGKVHMRWKGAQDLSGAIYLKQERDSLRLTVRVTDDVHVQRQSDPRQIWRHDSVQFRLCFPGQQGSWEIGGAESSGRALLFVWYAPQQFDPARAAKQFTLRCRRDNALVYEFTLPFTALGIDAATLRQGFRFNLIVNDDDGDGRKGWAQVAPGIGQIKDETKYPLVRFP
ncbi:beta-galactosidase [uncultured Victivallis sp.]|uniref:beta-galactosidase n=1 Tax=uncultured Victivallis sp. TaxID=354118 RepID=UPI0025FD82B1|nr:beta-galactosidase [uncultured Victivallis sp.]